MFNFIRKTILFFFLAGFLFFPFCADATTTSGELVKTMEYSAVYFVKDGVKHVFPHLAVYLSWGYPEDYSTVATISETVLDSYTLGNPVPFRSGYMFRGTAMSLHGKEASAVFIADDQKIRAISSGEVYQSLFNDPYWNLVTWIPDDFLSKFNYELGETVTSGSLHPDGSLIRYIEYPNNIYLIEGGKKRIVSSQAFTSNRFNQNRVVNLSYAKYNYSDGGALDTQEETWSESFGSAIVPKAEPIDYTKDSDNDTIPDVYDLHPHGGGEELVKNYSFIYEMFGDPVKVEVELQLKVPYDLYDYYVNHKSHEFANDFSNVATFVTDDDPIIKDIAMRAKQIAEQKNLNSIMVLQQLVDEIVYTNDINTGHDEYPKYPVETLVDGKGDCEDTSFLLASLLNARGLKTLLVRFKNHIGIAIVISNDTYNYYIDNGMIDYMKENKTSINSKIVYVETTDHVWRVSDMPINLIGEDYTLHTIK